MAALTNFPWGWGAPWKFICRRVRPRGHSRRCFYAVAFCLLRVSWRTSPRQLPNSSHFLANLSSTFNFEEPYSLENGSGNPNEYDKERNEFYEVGKDGSLQSSTEHPPSGRVCTNSLLALNILVYVGQYLSRGKLTLWGTKINSLIDVGQVWRLVTSSFLHGNIIHLLVNCYSLNTIGPTVEKLSGPTRFLAVYMASAIASDIMSYYLTEASSLGASGAIFGLVGSLTVFMYRHRNLKIGGVTGRQHLSAIASNIALNMVFGILCPGIDHWGHIGGFIGGASLSWLLGPAFLLVPTKEGRNIFLVDKPPISYLLGWRR